jgi:hypothetical protein
LNGELRVGERNNNNINLVLNGNVGGIPMTWMDRSSCRQSSADTTSATSTNVDGNVGNMPINLVGNIGNGP